MEIIWPILLLVTTFYSWSYKLYHWGEKVVLNGDHIFNKFVNLTCLTFLNAILLYLCGFFTVFAWPQIIWLILTISGFGVMLLFLMLFMVMPNFVENTQNILDRQNSIHKIGFVDIFSTGIILFLYWKGGAFHLFFTTVLT